MTNFLLHTQIHPPAVTFIGSKLKIESDYMKAMKFIDDNPDYFSAPITRKALALDKKNRPLIEALNSEFASVDVDDDDYANKLDDYRSKLAGLLKGTRNLVSYARIDGLIKSTASNLSYRSGRILSSVEAKDFILRVIHRGPITGTDAYAPLTSEERENLSDLLDTVDIRCY
ncbi:hypothetical protein HK100_003867 [Physocladia obscura]|uniref:Uncharacterized protein n=1 Tax=Physocladia obscura TaxID=109957 RepID=A0AAD5TCV2_9FUNG|nr:hypothetical protein HK100_003867 [Physocladia obscura]